MKADTRLFGKIDIEDEKIITFENGMIGFPHLQKFTLIYDEENKGRSSIMWLQSMDEPSVAFPVMHPNWLKPDYHPTVNEELLAPLGELGDENTYVLVTVTAMPDAKQSSVNLKAPIVINTDVRKGCQLIVEDDYPVKFRIYDAVREQEKTEGS